MHQYWNFVYPSFFCVSKQLISNIGNSSGHPIVPSDPSVFSVGNLHLLPPLNFSLEIRSLLPFHRSSQNPICHPGNLEAYPRISKTMLTPYLDTLFVHDRAILIQIEPLAAFDSQHTNIGILSTLPFRVSKQLISNIGNSSGHPIVPSEPSVSFCRKSVSSSSPEFLAGNPFIASFPSALVKSDLLFWKFGSLSSLTERPSSL